MELRFEEAIGNHPGHFAGIRTAGSLPVTRASWRILLGCSTRLCETEIFLIRAGRIMPAPGRRDSLACFIGAPRAFLVFVEWSAGLQHRIDNPPRFFHIVL